MKPVLRSGSRILAVVLAAVACARLRAEIRANGQEYLSLSDEAARIGMRATWIEKSQHQMALDGLGHHAEFEGTSREVTLDGVRLFLGEAAVYRGGDLYVSRTDFYRRLLGLLRPALWGKPPPHPQVIALDPGHGGRDHGTENPRLHIMEKTCTLEVAEKLKPLLEARGYKVFLTREEMRESEPKIDLPVLSARAIAAHADLFVSIHFNELADSRVTGSEVYMFPPQHQFSTEHWSNTRDHEDDKDQAAPANALDPWNSLFAHTMHLAVQEGLRNPDRGEKLKHLGVLRALPMPGVLIEAGFLSNDAEARKVASGAYQQKIAEAMAKGIFDYIAVLDQLRVPPAEREREVAQARLPAATPGVPTPPPAPISQRVAPSRPH